MLIKILISLGLVMTPFVFIKGYDTRDPKMLIALGVALAIGLSGIFKGKFKPFKNHWLLIFIGYLFISHRLLPQIFVGGETFANGWVWQCYTYIAIFFLMLLTVSSIRFSKQEITAQINIIIWCGMIMALYAVLQYFGFDSFFKNNANPDHYFINNLRVSGTLGHPTVLAPFFAILMPFALFKKKKLAIVLFIAALIVTNSKMAIGATIVGSCAYLFIKSKKSLIIASILAVLFLGGFGVGSYRFPGIIGDSGRIEHWKGVVSEVSKPIKGTNLSLIGFGLGSYPYFYKTRHNSTFGQVHNEYIEIFYNSGVIGLLLFLASIWYVFKTNFLYATRGDEIVRVFLASFLIMVLCGFGMFIWQIAPYNFYAIFILGILHNREVSYGC